MNLNNNSKTLFIPLYSKAMISKKRVFLSDKKAEEIISRLDYDFTKLKISKWLALFIGLRSSIIDELTNKVLSKNSKYSVVHLGCGLDSRCLRIKQNYNNWYDIDYKEVIEIRKKFYTTNSKYHMIPSSVNDSTWFSKIKESENILIVAEGLFMYLSYEDIRRLFSNINKRFKNVYLIFDSYTKKGLKLSKIKNPVNQFNAKIKSGFDNFEDLSHINSNLEHIFTHLIKKDDNNLKGLSKLIFNKLYCGKLSQELYKIYECKFK